MTKHYIRLDGKGNIIKGFSDKFEIPKIGDICINENAARHFDNDFYFPQKMGDTDGYTKYMWDGKIVLKEDLSRLERLKIRKTRFITMIKNISLRVRKALNPVYDNVDISVYEKSLTDAVDAARKEEDVNQVDW